MATDQLSDQEIQFKKRARRRLVGAIALVLLMITILPMVLDDRAVKTPQQDIDITIPSQDGGEFTSKIVPVVPDKEPAPSPPAAEANPKPATPALDKLPAQPVEGADVKPQTDPPAKPAAAKPGASEAKVPEKTVTDAGTFAVQIGVFSDAANVKQLQQKLQNQGYKSYTEKRNTANGEKIGLRAGPFATKAEAEDALSKIKGAGLPAMMVNSK